MALEIERRFLVTGEGWRPHVRWSAALRQGYLSDRPGGVTVRVRLSQGPDGARAWLTLKAPPPLPGPLPGQPRLPEQVAGPAAAALVRQEFEYPIPPADAHDLLALTTRQLVKTRHGLELDGGDWVVDVFEGANAPLLLAEVELEAPRQPVAVPAWCGLELTGRHDLSNAALAWEPFSAWAEPRRRPLLDALGSDLKIS